MKVVIVSIVLSVLGFVYPSAAQAVEPTMTTTVVKQPSCDRRAPRVEVTLNTSAERVGYGYVDSDTIYWLDTDGVEAGTHRYNLKRQPFGSTRQWVMVAGFKGAQGLYTNPTLTFTRPTRASCVITKDVSITAYATNVNQVCPEGSQKLFMLRTFVAKGSPGYFAGNGTGQVVLWSGRQVITEGYAVPSKLRENDFFFYPPRRGAKVNKSSLVNSVSLVLSSKNVVVSLGELSSDCIEEFAE